MGDEHALARGREQIRGHHVPEIVKNPGRIRRAAQDDRQARAVREGGHQEKVPGARRQRTDPAGDQLAQGRRDVGRPPGEHGLDDPGPPGQFQQEHRVPAGELEQVQQRTPAQPDGGPGGDQVPGCPRTERAEDQPVQPPRWDGIGRESRVAAGPAGPDRGQETDPGRRKPAQDEGQDPRRRQVEPVKVIDDHQHGLGISDPAQDGDRGRGDGPQIDRRFGCFLTQESHPNGPALWCGEGISQRTRQRIKQIRDPGVLQWHFEFGRVGVQHQPVTLTGCFLRGRQDARLADAYLTLDEHDT